MLNYQRVPCFTRSYPLGVLYYILYTVLYYVILYYIMLYYIILYYINLYDMILNYI